VLISDHVHQHLIDRFRESGYLIHYLPEISYAGFKAVLNNYNGVIINSKIKMTKEVLESHAELEFIGRLGSGLDIIDLPTAERLKIKVFAAPEGNRNAVAEHAVGMLLCLENKIMSAHQSVLDQTWQREANRGEELEKKTIGIIGFGHTGSSFAKKWKGWDLNILAYDKYKENYADDLEYVKETDLEEVLAKSDIISIHLPLTKETEHMVNGEFIAKMKDQSILINTARGKNVVTEDLLEGLKQGKLKGACLDVLENEKMDQLSEAEQKCYQALFNLPNVVLTPHVAGWSKQSFFKISDVLADKILIK